MAQFKLKGVTVPDPNGTAATYWGYPVVVKDGEVWAEIPKELVDIEVSAGRIDAPVKEDVKPVGRPPKVE